MPETLEDRIKDLPESPGVYLMKNAGGKIIYVGKAVNLKNRVRSYFSSQHADSPKTRALVSHIRDLEFIITDNEIEALILESNLIKAHKPKYNIRLTDDKNYPYLRVTVQEPYPRVEIARSRKKDGARYFGPYTNTGYVNETLRLLKKIFPVRSCKQTTFARQARPCLNAHIERCAAPCCGRISQEDYRKMIDEVVLFLEGKQEALIKALKKRMGEAADQLDFEKAAELRDQLSAIEKIIARQKIVTGSFADFDVVNLARGANITCVQIFFVRGGKLLGRDHFIMEGTEGTETGEILASFIQQYYDRVDYLPPEILLPERLEDAEVLENWLTGKKGARVRFRTPQKGEKQALLEMVGKNAAESLQHELKTKARQEDAAGGVLSELPALLGLDRDKEISRIECYDISHIQGAETVASMVVFEEGKARPSQYRRFKIRTVEGPDDFASMAEVIERRFMKADAGGEKFGILPDLVVIDGGKGQLSAARQAMTRLGYDDIPAAALAKENEWIFLEHSPDPLILPRDSQALYLLQRIRDEAHRFAVTYHRLLRGKRNLTSVLDEIPGIGPKRKTALLQHFGLSLKKIMNASVEELTRVEGISGDTAQQVWDFFHPAEIE